MYVKQWLVGLLVLPGLVLAAPKEGEVEKINERYEDFFRYRRYLEERLEKLEEGQGDRQAMLREHARRLEAARKMFVESEQAKPSDEPLRVKWEAEQRARELEREKLRLKHVAERDQLEAYRLRGRKIPEMKEYGLDEYE